MNDSYVSESQEKSKRRKEKGKIDFVFFLMWRTPEKTAIFRGCNKCVEQLREAEIQEKKREIKKKKGKGKKGNGFCLRLASPFPP